MSLDAVPIASARHFAAFANACRLELAPLQDVTGWVDRHPRIWENRLDRMDDYLRELQATPKLAAKRRTRP